MLVVPLRFLLQPAVKAYAQMIPLALGAKVWSTSTIDTTPDTSPLELRELGDHLDRCRRACGKFHPALCLSERMNNFLAPRVITTLAVLAVVAAGFAAG